MNHIAEIVMAAREVIGCSRPSNIARAIKRLDSAIGKLDAQPRVASIRVGELATRYIAIEFPEPDHGVDVTVIHGAADGADTLAGIIANGLGYRIEAYPANWDSDGKAAGPRRNARMLAEGKPDRGLAFGALYRDASARNTQGMMRHYQRQTGTGDMVRRMLAALNAAVSAWQVSEPAR